MSYSRVKQSISGDSLSLTPLEKALKSYWNKEESLEDLMDSLEDQDFSEEDVQALYGADSKDFLVALVKAQAHPELASWLLQKTDLEDNLKEDLVMEFLEYEDLLHQSDSDLFYQIYTQGFLSTKEKTYHLKKSSSKNVLSLAVFYSAEDKELELILPFADALTLSFFIQDQKVNSFPLSLLSKVKENLSSKDAVALIRKTKGISKEEKKQLVDMVVSFEDADDCFLLLYTENYELASSPEKLLSCAVKSEWFNLKSIPLHIQSLCIDYGLKQNLFEIKHQKDKQTLVLFDDEIAIKEENKKVEMLKRLGVDAELAIEKAFSKKEVVLPESLKGYYNFHTNTFESEDQSYDTSKVKFKVMEPTEDSSNSILLWKPNLKIPAILKKQEETYFVHLRLEKLSLDIMDFKSASIEELQQKFKDRMKVLKSKIPVLPMNPKRPFGVEIEVCLTYMTPSDLALFMGAEDLSENMDGEGVQSTRKAALPSWAVKYDETIKHIVNGKALKEEVLQKQKRYTAEIVTPKLYGEEGLSELRSKLEDLLTEHKDNVSVNATCGLHVHHDLQELFDEKNALKPLIKEQLEQELGKVQESIYSLIAEDRRHNAYCPRLEVGRHQVQQPTLAIKSSEGNRIRRPRPGFNLFTGYGTVEFRMHEATLDVETIVNWVKITHHVIDEIIKKIYTEKSAAIKNLKTTLEFMEMEKLRKLQSEQDLNKALSEVEEFLNSNAYAKIFVNY